MNGQPPVAPVVVLSGLAALAWWLAFRGRG